MSSVLLQKAQTGLRGAKALLDIGDTDGACSRAYYAMYDAARATLAWADKGDAFKSHKGLLTAFAEHLVKPGLFPAEPGRAIHRAQAVRQLADSDVVPVSSEDAALTVREAEDFVATAAALIATAR